MMKLAAKITLLMMLTFLLLHSSCKEDEDYDDNTFGVNAQFTIDPETGSTSTTFTFDATPTQTQGDYETITYEWNFGDGTQLINANKTETHQYNSTGQYNVLLVVKIYRSGNSGSAGDEITKTLTVSGV